MWACWILSGKKIVAWECWLAGSVNLAPHQATDPDVHMVQGVRQVDVYIARVDKAGTGSRIPIQIRANNNTNTIKIPKEVVTETLYAPNKITFQKMDAPIILQPWKNQASMISPTFPQLTLFTFQHIGQLQHVQ